MKTIDVRIGCSDQFQVFVHDVLLAVEKEYPVTAQITVTELPPPQGDERSCENCGNGPRKTNKETMELLDKSERDGTPCPKTPCLFCMRNQHYGDEWQPKSPKVHGIDCLFDESKDCKTCEANPKQGQPAAPVAPAVEGKRNSCDGCEYDNGPHLTPCNSCCDGEIRLNYKPIKPYPSCEKLRAENDKLMDQLRNAEDYIKELNQPKGE
jgi:hypothetical protein